MTLRTSLLTGMLVVCAVAPPANADDLFRDSVGPLLESKCLSCHNPRDRKGGLSLESAMSLQRGGESGEVISTRNPDTSYLIDLVTPVDGKAEMPKGGKPLSQEEIDLLRQWIEQGAYWPETVTLQPEAWWSFRPLRTPDLPVNKPLARVDGTLFPLRTPIDAFIARELHSRQLPPAVEADRRTLIRRLYSDLIGLPPTPEQMEAFVHDPDPLAYEKLVDQLLDSPHYGERWARHWLDLVKYADTYGYDKDQLRKNAWPYRDYVIRSFNEDKTYHRFIEEQVAGDILFPGTPDGILGLGMIAAGPWDLIGHVEVSESKIDGKIARMLDRDDMVGSVMNAFCSVTVQCARCHDHKFDPVTQAHYYGLQSVFAAVDRADRMYDTDPAVERRRFDLDEQLRERHQELAELKQETQAEDPPQRQQKRKELEATIQTIRAELKSLPAGHLVHAAATHFSPRGSFHPTKGRPRPVHVLHRGDVQEPRELAVPGAIPAVPSLPVPFDLPPDHTEGDRRAALAKWITRHDNPLTWRSIVNRVWQFHFGEGLVTSPNDFGRMGQTPTHPELLDWLAVHFRDEGQSFKKLHRLILTSSVYRQSSRHHAGNAAMDGSNQFLWRMNRRRMDAEEIRDAILSVSGCLDQKMGGPGYFLFVLEKTEHSPHYEYQLFDPSDPTTHRRSIYRFVVRSQPDPYMTTLDCADSSQSVPQRNETVTALQALALLNNRFNLYMCERFAERLAEFSPDQARRVSRGFELVAGRPPTPDEHRELLNYANQHGLPNLCRVLLNLNELIYLD